jgi:hypothetical protein
MNGDPSLRTCVRACTANRPDCGPRTAAASVHIRAAVALGAAFLAPLGVDLSWCQTKAGRPDRLWSLSAARDPTPVDIDQISGDVSSQDMAIVVSMTTTLKRRSDSASLVCRAFAAMCDFAAQVEVRPILRHPGRQRSAAFRLIKSIGDAWWEAHDGLARGR